ncbi:MAG: diphosphate--fructose-6-phosphate 1-phosphotransferase [Rhodospirillaceae bacterium]|nr:diphosphate--fructose-6-phosphate 1-phosphotransferase [Rhodospirillaceae bacterium]
MRMVIAQGGGPTAVINESLAAAVRRARALGAKTVLGARNGIRGLAEDRLVDLTALDAAALDAVAATACSALGSTRDKPDAAYLERVAATLDRRGLDAMLYIGGNDTARTLALLAASAAAAGRTLACVHVPKTIDNDLVDSDLSPGWPSAARFVANAFAGLDMDMWAMPGIYVGVVMGRHAGWLTAAAALWRRGADDGPHLVYVPERPFAADRFADDVRAVAARLGRCVVAVSEGIAGADGKPAVQALVEQAGGELECDAHGNVQLTTSALGEALRGHLLASGIIGRVRADTLGFVQRAYAECRSPVDVDAARRVGTAAAEAAAAGHSGAVTIRADGASLSTGLVPLDRVAGKKRLMPEEFLAAERADVAPAFLEYALPLVGPPPPLAHLDMAADGTVHVA